MGFEILGGDDVKDSERIAAWMESIAAEYARKRSSWSEARKRATASAPWADLAEIHRIAEWVSHDARAAICDRLADLGAPPGFHGRDIEMRLGLAWFVGPLDGRGPDHVQWATTDPMTEDASDWSCDPIDMEAPEAQRVQTFPEVTMVLTEGYGVVILSTERRIAPVALRFRRRAGDGGET